MALNININLNDYIWVELNNVGWDIIRKFYDRLYDNYHINNKEELINNSVNRHKDNTKTYIKDITTKETVTLTEYQLHEFMNIFGEHLYNGCTTPIVNNTLYLTIDGFIEKL